jgi:nucleotide-binding universal stress UspA family protein
MFEIKRILVPTDFSEGSDVAVAVAQKMAYKFGAEVDLIHVIPELQHFMRFLSSDMNMEYSNQLLETAQKRMDVSMMNFDEEIRGEYFIKMDRKPHETILQHAKNRGYDLIIMGAKGEHKTKMRRGGITRDVIRNSQVPVLTVDNDKIGKEIKKVMVPTDGSELSFTALIRASRLAAVFGADITLFYVAELYAGLTDTALVSPESIQKDKIYEKLAGKLERFLKGRKDGSITLNRMKQNFGDTLDVKIDEEISSVKLKIVIVTGFSPHYEIETYAETHSDLVVMATHGHSGFANLFLGSVTEKVLQYLKKPVLTIRPSEAEFKRSEKISDLKKADPFP